MELFHSQPVLWFTGLSGAGKTTLGEGVRNWLLAMNYQVTFLDGDQIRRRKKSLGFSVEDRDQHIRDVAKIAAGAQLQGDFVVVCLISPFERMRLAARDLCQDFVEIYVNTPIAECEKRDPKGLYKKVRRGEISNFTGIDQAYEQPSEPEIIMPTVDRTPEVCVDQIIQYLGQKGYVRTRQVA